MNSSANLMLWAGIAAAIIFVAVTVVEIVARPGFSIQRHAISMLSLGERGWVMMATFILSGLLVLAFALGFWQTSGALITAILFGIYGLGLVLAGIFPAPAGLGFPPGTPDDMQPVMDRGATIHSIAFMLAFGALILSCFALGIHFWQQGAMGLGIIVILTGLAIPVFIGTGMASIIPTGVAFYIAAVLAWLPIIIAAWHHMRG